LRGECAGHNGKARVLEELAAREGWSFGTTIGFHVTISKRSTLNWPTDISGPATRSKSEVQSPASSIEGNWTFDGVGELLQTRGMVRLQPLNLAITILAPEESAYMTIDALGRIFHLVRAA